MPNLAITSTAIVGNSVVVEGTAESQVTCELHINGVGLYATQTANPVGGKWSVTFANVPAGSFTVNASTADPKSVTNVPVPYP